MEGMPRVHLSVIGPLSPPTNESMCLQDFLRSVEGHFRECNRARSEADPAEGRRGVGLRPTESAPNLRINLPTMPAPGRSTPREREVNGMRVVSPQMLG